MNVPGFYALEGGVCSGKTSVCSVLKSKYNWDLISEYMDYIPANKIVEQPFLPAKQRLELFSEIEIRREKISYPKDKIIFDRSILSIFAFEFALINLGFESELLEYKFSDSIQLPLYTFFLTVDSKERMRRWKERGNSIRSIFVDDKFNYWLEQFFILASKSIEIEILNLKTDIETIGQYIDHKFRGVEPSTKRLTPNELLKQIL